MSTVGAHGAARLLRATDTRDRASADREAPRTAAIGSAALILTTPRLLLRPFDLRDAATLAALAAEHSVADATIDVPHPLDAEKARHWIVDDLARCSGEQRMFAVADRHSRRLLGSVGLRNLDSAHRHGELTFWLGEVARGRGYATESAARLLEYGGSALRLRRVVAHFMLRNDASRRVLQKLGFSREAILRRRVVKWGRPEDVELWARAL